MKTRRLFRTVVDLLLLGAILAVALNYQSLADQWALSHYYPTSDIAAYMSRIQLTTAGRAILYRADPAVDSKAQFNTDCQTQVGSLELGCFYRNRIFVLRIDNADLAPEMDVVASHELLHAVWARMSATDRKTLGDELERVYAGLNDADLKARMAQYATSEPGEETNELHSILGTEYANLSPVLEAHYAKYFVSRSQIVSRHIAYKAVFDTRRAELDNQLANIRALKAQLSSLNAQMEAERASGNIDAYNANVPRQNSLANQVNQLIADYHTAVDEYNALSKTLDSEQIQPGE